MSEPVSVETRVSSITGDRVCLGCGHTLMAQPVMREPHYQLLICRCPECGAVSSLQDYPVLGAWGRRWGLVIAGLWCLIVVLLIPGFGAMMFGMATGTTFESVRELRSSIREAHYATTPAGKSRPDIPFSTWWNAQDQSAVLEASGWSLRSIPPEAWVLLGVGTGLAFLAGTILSIVVPHLRVRGRLVVAGVVLAFAALGALIIDAAWTQDAASWTETAALSMVGGRMLVAALAVFAVGHVAGILSGRAIVRGLARALLPPRARGGLAPLWRMDGLVPPAPGLRGPRREEG